MRQTTRFAIAFGFMVATPLAYGADLLEVYQRALQSDPQIREAEATRLATLEAKPQALAGLLPTLNGTGSYTSRDQEGQSSTLAVVGGVPVVGTTKQTIDATIKQYQIQLVQPLFRWDRWVALRRADEQVAQAEADFHAAEQNLVFRVSQRYFNVLSAKDQLEATEGALTAVSRQLEQAEQRFEVGLIAITDVQESRAAADQARAAVIAAKRTLSTNQELLRELTGEMFTTLAAPGEDMPLNSPSPASEEQWVAAAMEQNLALISSRLSLDIAKEAISTARTGRYPTLDLVGTRFNNVQDADQVNNGNPSPANTDVTQDSIALQVTVPFYSGGAVSSRVREQVYRHRAARERLERTARETERAARDAYLGVNSNISRVEALRQAVESSRTALRASEAGFDVGTRTTVDVLDAQRRLLDAETNYARSKYDYIIGIIQLKQAAGTLSREDLAEINGWLRE
jgi:outer membrane protein